MLRDEDRGAGLVGGVFADGLLCAGDIASDGPRTGDSADLDEA